jgi:molybdopterin synthase catalytic subunit
MTVRVQKEDFDLTAEVRALTNRRSDIGAVVTFTGLVRGGSDDAPIATLELEHYPAMTEAEIRRVEADALARWPLAATLIIHRFGTLAPGDNIVLVVTASAHRGPALEAASFLMDYLKSRAPFWKKETGPGGETRWVEARESDEAALARWQDTTKAGD